MLEEKTHASFADFVTEVEPRLHAALVPSLGVENGREATAEALAWAWEHWYQVSSMKNPAGYLYRVARTKARNLYPRRPPPLPAPPASEMPWVEPGLSDALARLSDRQRTVVMLIHGFGWTQAEVGEVLGIAQGAVQQHAQRGLKRLRRWLGGETWA